MRDVRHLSVPITNWFEFVVEQDPSIQVLFLLLDWKLWYLTGKYIAADLYFIRNAGWWNLAAKFLWHYSLNTLTRLTRATIKKNKKATRNPMVTWSSQKVEGWPLTNHRSDSLPLYVIFVYSYAWFWSGTRCSTQLSQSVIMPPTCHVQFVLYFSMVIITMQHCYKSSFHNDIKSLNLEGKYIW